MTTAQTVPAQQGVFAGMPTPLYAASPSRLLAFLDCPRRYRLQYLDRPRPAARPRRAHTSVGLATHNALRDWWDLEVSRRTPAAARELVGAAWIETGFRDARQSARWRRTVTAEVSDYLRGVDPQRQPRGIERTVSLRTGCLTLAGRVDRLDERVGEHGEELVVVDYKTSRRVCTDEQARTSLALALYAVAAGRMFRRRCVRVELHHVPSGSVAAFTHTPESLLRKLDEADSIARDARSADASYHERGAASPAFPPLPSALCTWCDYRAACPEGQRMGPEKSSWAALEPDLQPDPPRVRADHDDRRTHAPDRDPDQDRDQDRDQVQGQGPSAGASVGARGRQPEGRGGQDHLGGQSGGGVR